MVTGLPPLNAPELGRPGVVLIVHWVLEIVAVKLPLLWLKPVVSARTVTATVASRIFVVLLGMVLLCCCSLETSAQLTNSGLQKRPLPLDSRGVEGPLKL